MILHGLQFYDDEKLHITIKTMGDRWVVTEMIPQEEFLEQMREYFDSHDPLGDI